MAARDVGRLADGGEVDGGIPVTQQSRVRLVAAPRPWPRSRCTQQSQLAQTFGDGLVESVAHGCQGVRIGRQLATHDSVRFAHVSGPPGVRHRGGKERRRKRPSSWPARGRRREPETRAKAASGAGTFLTPVGVSVFRNPDGRRVRIPPHIATGGVTVLRHCATPPRAPRGAGGAVSPTSGGAVKPVIHQQRCTGAPLWINVLDSWKSGPRSG